MYCLLFCLLCNEGKLSVIDSMGVSANVLVFKEESGFLMVSRSDSRLAVTDRAGKMTAEYNKKGEGPTDLKHPVYLGRYKGGYLVLTHDNRLIVFDAKLTPKPAGKLDQPFTDFYLGLKTKQDWYWVYRGLSRGPNLVVSVRASENTFTIKKAFHPQPLGKVPSVMDLGDQYHITLQNGKVFKMLNAVCQDYYEVEISSDLASEDSLMMLTASLEGVPPIMQKYNFIAGPEAGFEFPDGYLVLWTGKRKISDGRTTHFIDVFSQKGVFQRRLEDGDDLVPCVNAPLVFEYNETDNRYHVVESIATWLKTRPAP